MSRFAIAIACALAMSSLHDEAQQPARVTILYDAFGPTSALQKDWGFAALVEYGGRRILFDTGNDAAIFARNLKQLGVDLTRLDAVVISHRHGDHTTGLEVLVAANPTVPIYAPQEAAFFRGGAPKEFLVRDTSLPAHMRYFDGKDPNALRSGTPWPLANFQIVTRTTEILSGFFVLTTRSDKAGTREMNELSLAIRTPKGLAVVVGCSHPGVENILVAAAQIDSTRLVLVLSCSCRDSSGRKTRASGGGNGAAVMSVMRPDHSSVRSEGRADCLCDGFTRRGRLRPLRKLLVLRIPEEDVRLARRSTMDRSEPRSRHPVGFLSFA